MTNVFSLSSLELHGSLTLTLVFQFLTYRGLITQCSKEWEHHLLVPWKPRSSTATFYRFLVSLVSCLSLKSPRPFICASFSLYEPAKVCLSQASKYVQASDTAFTKHLILTNQQNCIISSLSPSSLILSALHTVLNPFFSLERTHFFSVLL